MTACKTYLAALLLCVAEVAFPQTAEFHGQASGWLSADLVEPQAFQSGLRYIPDVLAQEDLGKGWSGDLEVSLNAFTVARYAQTASPTYDTQLKLYRTWVRAATDRFEARVGLQKITFGSALLLRPLMWFDRIDPRDPLQLTDGVYGILLRYYFQNNANLWLWGLYGNNETKGWELEPTEKKTIEFGGRAQAPLWTGEIGVTYHHRRVGLSSLSTFTEGSANVPEDRLGLDGKWDIGIGIWFEGAISRQTGSAVQDAYQRLGTVGADYTFSVGNGLYAAAEVSRMDSPSEPLGASDGRTFTGLMVTYPLGVLDQFSAIVLYDWESGAWYRSVNWQRKYDNWSFYCIGFWNPASVSIYGQAGTGAFAGTGLQLIVVFNH